MERLYQAYSRKGVAFLHCFAGEAPRTATDFQKHYRSAFPHLVDPDRGFERRHNRNGWPFYLVVDRKGDIVFAKTTSIDREEEIMATLDRVATGAPARVEEHNGTRYLEKTVRSNRASRRVRETFPCLVADRKGDLFLSYVTNEAGRNEVRLRRPGGAGRDLIVSGDCPDAYYAVMTVDARNGKWIFYTGLAGTGRYDVFARRLDEEGALSDPVNLTRSDDDAMHPAAAVDAGGNVWVVYYRWHKMGFFSRDKEVYARVFDGVKWSSEMRLSPGDVPVYEDHTDPAVAPGPGGGVRVAWSWDMHPLEAEKYKRYQSLHGARDPTIFGRALAQKSGPGALLFFGAAGFDGTPELSLASDGRLWCAWISLAGSGKALLASVCGKDESDRGAQYVVERGGRDVCTPRFFERDGTPCLLWASQDAEGRWRLKSSAFADKKWSSPRLVADAGNPRFPSVARDGAGRLWVACSRDEGDNRKVVRTQVGP